MRLLVDLGNTRLKWMLAEGTEVRGRSVSLAWDEADFEARLEALLAVVPAVESIWIASVAGLAREARVREALHGRFGIEPQTAVAASELCGIRLAYRDPLRMGIDRVMALVAVQAAGHAPCVLASLGTALTLDAMAGNGEHLGGLIVAGPDLMQKALVEAAGRVTIRREGQIGWFADNTEDAMAGGSWWAAAALVERFYDESAKALGLAPRLILTGGAAPRLQPLLRIAAIEQPDAVLRGLALCAQHAADEA